MIREQIPDWAWYRRKGRENFGTGTGGWETFRCDTSMENPSGNLHDTETGTEGAAICKGLRYDDEEVQGDR